MGGKSRQKPAALMEARGDTFSIEMPWRRECGELVEKKTGCLGFRGM